MTRIILISLLLFLTPFFLYALYLRMRGQKDNMPQRIAQGPAGWLIFCGVALVAMSLVFLAVFTGGDTDAVYQPARYENGELIPGGFADAPSSAPGKPSGPPLPAESGQSGDKR